MLVTLLGFAATARAGVTVNLRMYSYESGYFAFPNLSLNTNSPNPSNTAYFAWGPTSSQTSGIHYELYPNGSGGSSSVYGTFSSFMTAINGDWTLMVTNTTSTNMYTFSVDASGLTAADFPTVTVTYPAHNALISSPNPLFTWSGPSNWQGELRALVRDTSFSFFRSEFLPSDDTSWSSPDPLPAGTLIFGAYYSSNVTAQVSIGTPLDDVTSDPLPGWVTGATVESRDENQFQVQLAFAETHVLVGRYDFEDLGALGEDSSGNGVNANGGSGWGSPDNDFDSDAVVGDYAGSFFGNGTVDWSPPSDVHDTMREAFAGSFTVSAWLKTSASIGNDNDTAINGMNILWAYANPDGVIPLAITGSKLAFFTGAAADPGHTLRSSSQVNDDAYHHVVVTRNIRTGEKKLYVDGVLEATGTGSKDRLDGNGSQISLGGSFNVFNRSYTGLLDDLQIYRGVLSAGEVAALYNTPGTTTPNVVVTEAVAHYNFNNGTAQAADVSGYRNDIITLGTFGSSDPEYHPGGLASPGAVEFFGDSYLTAPRVLLNSLAQSFSVSLWLKTAQTLGDEDDPADFGAGVVAADIPGTDNDVIPIALTGGQVAFNTGGGFDDTLNTAMLVNDDDWHHVVVTRNHVTGEKKIYVDRFLRASSTGTTAVLDEPRLLTLGALSDASDPDPASHEFNGYNGFEGLLDDVQFYSGALTESQVQFLYDHPGVAITNASAGGSGNQLDEAVDAPTLTWTTGGNADWFRQTNETHDGEDAAQSGPIADDQESWIQTTVNGPGRISFWWNVSSQEVLVVGGLPGTAAAADGLGDNLDFSLDGNVQSSIYGEWGWEAQSYKIPPGLHTLQWRYHKDASDIAGADAGWLDEVEFDPNVDPEITFIPGNVTAFSGTNVTLAVQLYGSPAPTIRWFKNGALLPNQTNATLVLTNVQPADSANYSLSASNFLGVAVTGNIRVNVFDPTDIYPLGINAPALAGSQTLVPISWVVTNTGPGFGSNTLDQVYLVATNGDLSFIGQMSRAGAAAIVPPGSTYTLSNLFRLPSVGAGDYSLRVNLDVFNSMLEVNETNNSLTTSTITIINPDLQPGNVQATLPAVGGLTLQVRYNVTNNGPAIIDGASWNDHIVLSTDNQWSDDDANLLQPANSPTIGVGQFISRTNTVTLPVVPSGNYYVVVRADRFGSFDHGNLWEVNETNNQAFAAVQITIPDLVPTNLVAPVQVSPQQPVNISWSIQNIGDATAMAWNPAFSGEWIDRLYFSTNQVAGPGAAWTGDELFWYTPLPAGEFMTNSRTINVPNLTEGDYYLVIVADVSTWVREINETNNQLSVPIRVASPDLVPTRLTAPALADAHSAIEVSWAVTNRGAGLAQPTWRDKLYLSTNAVLDAGDIFLGEFQRSTVTPGGGTYNATNNVFLPGIAAGNYFLIFRADALFDLYESNSTNNYLTRAINIAAPDLVVTALDAPTNVASQQPITITFSVANIGATTAQPIWYERVFLSTNAVLDAADVPVGTPNGQTFNFSHTTALPVGNSYTQQVDLRIPAAPAGDYFLLFQTDGTNAFTEVNEGNNFFARALHLDNPDLIPTNIIAPASITITQLNQHIEVGWNVLNQNTGAVQVTWNDYIYLSTNNVLDGNDDFIGSQGNALNLGFNQAYLAFDNPALPNGIQGQFYLLVKADGPNQVFESEETNNVRAHPLQVIIPPLPDLSVVEITAPIEALSGQQIEITWVLTNRGTATAFGPFRDRVYLATTAGGGGAVEYGSFEFTGAIPPGGSVERVQRINLPISLSGQRWVLVVADANNNLFEFDQEGNNSLITAQPIDIILAPTPNLVVTSATAPTEIFSGTPMLVTWAVTNQGTGPTSSPLWYDGVYLSADTNFGGDTFLGYAPNQAYLSPGDAYAGATIVNIPRSLNGTHYIFVRTDYGNSVFENLDEGDNITMSGPVFINLTPPPDLRVDAVNPPLTAFSGGAGVQLSYAITNHGLGQTLETAWWDRVYLSTNTTIDGNDHVLIAYQHVGGLEPGAGYRVTNSFGLPAGVTGDWYLLVRADVFNHVYEVPFEANNDGAPAFATTIALTPPPDLVTTIQFAPTNALASHFLTVRYRVANEGITGTPTYHWRDRLYLSADTNFDAGTDLQLSYLNYSEGNLSVAGAPPPLASDYTRTISGLLPDGLSGTFYIFVRCDDNDEVFELDNANNIARASNAVTVISQPADLVVRSLTAPATAEAGSAMLVSWIVTNRSGGDSAVTRWYDRLVLSADDFTGDNDDVRLADLQHDDLLGGTNEYAVNNAYVSLPIWLSAGEYRLYLVTDRGGDVYEGTNEDNNISALQPITIIRQTADLQITSATGPTAALSGGTLAATWRVQNSGTRPPNTAAWVDSVYLSTDTVLSPSDVRLGRRQNHSSPAPGSSYTNSLGAAVPLGLNGDYYLIIVTDEFNQVEESGAEANNQFVVSPAVSITPAPAPDLVVTAVNAPDVGYSGQAFEMSYVVQNAGTASARANWYDAVYLSLDHFLDPYVDTYLGFRTRTADLGVGASYTNTASYEIPQGYSGPFYVLVTTDVSRNVYEAGSETNNLALDPQAMQVQLTPPVDLVAGPITVPANASPGVNATIAFTIYNYGSNVARGAWTDSLYISADTNYDVGDALFGSVRHLGDVGAGSNYSAQLTAPLPGVLPGDYHVIVRSDILNNVIENNNTNNAGASLDLVDIDSEVLVLGTPDPGLIAQGQSLYYKFNATAGETVRVRFTTGVPLAGNEIYVRFGAMPSRAESDFSVSEPFIADPDLFIPIAQTGTHYLLVYCGAMPIETPYTILAEVLPFSVATVQPTIVGDRGSTTFKVRGALFSAETHFELLNDTNTIVASGLTLEDSTTAYVTFNLAGQPQGYWSLQASLTQTSVVASALSNAITLVSGSGAKPEVAIDGPLEVWAAFTQPVLLLYGNSGDSDALAPLLIAEGVDGTLVGPDRNRLQSAPMQILGRSLDGPSDRLRPQTSFSHRMVYRGGALHVQSRVMRADSPRGITEADWLEIEASVRPPGLPELDWQAFWANIRPRIGASWGDYVKFLHRLAEGFPAEERIVRAMFGSIYTNQPGFRASSYISGVVLGATNNAPQADVGVGFYLVTTNDSAVLGGSAITDANGQFLVPHIQPGQYVVVMDNTAFKDFDMDQNGDADTNGPTFTVAEGVDLANQTIYLHQPTVPEVITNDTDATLITDSRGVLHVLWYRQDRLWHAWNDDGTWVDAKPITTNVIGAAAVAQGASLLDGSTPGLMVVWDQAATNRVDLFYSVGQTNGDGYRWSQPVQLTSDLVEHSSPAVVVQPDGTAIITYLKAGLGAGDDTDVYYSGVNLVSGELLWNIPAPRPVQAKPLEIKQAIKWTKDLYAKPLGPDTEFKFAVEVSGEIARRDCSADATASASASAKVETDKGFLEGKLSGDLGMGFYVDPDECEWAYREGSATGNFHGGVTLGFKNVIFRVLEAYPPVRPFSFALEDFVNGFGNWLGVEFENNLELGTTLHLRGVSWDDPPIKGWGFPEISSADAEVTGAIKFGVKKVGKDDPTNLRINLLDPNPDKTKFTVTTAFQVSISAQFYPEWKPQTIKITPTIEISFPNGWTYSPSASVVPELVIDLSKPQPPPTFARDTNFLNGTLIHKPATAIGTTNVYGTNSVLANVQLDVLREGAPALALDAAGVPYQIWFRELDPYGPDYGTELRMADFTGTGWTAPAVIPGTKGFNSQVVAATDPLGRRMAIWVHGDASNLTTNMTVEEFFNARDAVNLHYSIYDGVNWSAPQPVAPTEGPDSNVQVSTMTNGSLLAVWTFNDTNNLVHLLASVWNGTTWTAPQEIASGKIRTPSAQQIAGGIHLLWTDSVGTNRQKGLFESVNVGGVWSAPSPFNPKPAARPAPRPDPEFTPADSPLEKSAAGAALAALLGDFPDKCCECKGKTTIVTNIPPPPKPCGISLVGYDYEKCQKIYEFKACPRVSMDPNDIVGPAGFGPERWVAISTQLNYTIRFENDALLADAPAKEVIITLPLDPDFNLSTFRLGSFGFGDITVPVPDGRAFYSTILDLTEEHGFFLNFFAGVDVVKGEAFWRLSTIDPATGFLPLDPLLGFLPPNVTSPEGEGFVNFSIRSRSGSPTGAQLDAKATIIFDTQPPIDTPPIFNSVDAGLPASAVFPLPASTLDPNFIVQWTALDNDGESGLAGVNVYVSEDGGDYFLWLPDTTLTQSPFVGEPGVEYSFYTVARDNAGNIEPTGGAPDATILIALPNTPPLVAAQTNRTIPALLPFTLQISATDTDAPPQTLTFELINAPAGMTLGTNSGVLNWTPTALQGGSSNAVLVRVTDNGLPPLSNSVGFNVVVLPANFAPVFDAATNLLTPVLQVVRNRLHATDPETNTIVYSFGPNPPPTATLHPQSGDFRWSPPLTAAGTTNLITVLATDDGIPSLTSTQQFVVFVPHYVQITLGQTNLFAGQTGSIPVRVTASAPWRGLGFGLELPAGALDDLSVSEVVSPFTTATVTPVDSVRSWLVFTNAPGHELSGTQQVASLVFHAASSVSLSVPLAPLDFGATLEDGHASPTLFTDAGRVIIVAEQPVLDAVTVLTNRHQLRLYGVPGETYQLQTATNLTPPIFWLPFTDVVLSNIVQSVEGASNNAPFRIYRAVKE